jgi:hypothetical protein
MSIDEFDGFLGDEEFVFASGGVWVTVSRWFERDIEPLFERCGISAAEVPFPEDAGRVSGALKYFCEGLGARDQSGFNSGVSQALAWSIGATW